MTLLHRWHAAIAKSRWRTIFKSLYEATVTGELAAARTIDKLAMKSGDACALEDVTAIIKSFERPVRLHGLVNSIKCFYPRLKIIVVDDSRAKPEFDESLNVELVSLPFDSGVSHGRSAGLRSVKTKYVLTLDDDFIFYRHTDLCAAMKLMRREETIDIMGGAVIDLPLLRTHDYRDSRLLRTTPASVLPRNSNVGGLPVYDKVPNFFLARTARLRLIDWTPEIKRLDHGDFFTRAKGTLLTVYNANMKILHAKSLFDEAYLTKRYDCANDIAVLKSRYDLK